jgi:amphi-Trp domain-containing protein
VSSKKGKQSFRHESLQDRKSIVALLRSVTEGLESGKLKLSDDDGRVVLKPDGLLDLRVTASQEDERDRLNIRISWQSKDKLKKKKKSLDVSN